MGLHRHRGRSQPSGYRVAGRRRRMASPVFLTGNQIVGRSLLRDADHRRLMRNAGKSLRDHRAALVKDEIGLHASLLQKRDDHRGRRTGNLLLAAEGKIDVVRGHKPAGKLPRHRLADRQQRRLGIQRTAAPDPAVRPLRAERIVRPGRRIGVHYIIVSHQDGRMLGGTPGNPDQRAVVADPPSLSPLEKNRITGAEQGPEGGERGCVRTPAVRVGNRTQPDHLCETLQHLGSVQLHLSSFPLFTDCK